MVAACIRASGGSGAVRPRRVRKLEDDYFNDWAPGTELCRDGFKRIMRVELRKWSLEGKGGVELEGREPWREGAEIDIILK
jgi:hypothetical protein